MFLTALYLLRKLKVNPLASITMSLCEFCSGSFTCPGRDRMASQRHHSESRRQQVIFCHHFPSPTSDIPLLGYSGQHDECKRSCSRPVNELPSSTAALFSVSPGLMTEPIGCSGRARLWCAPSRLSGPCLLHEFLPKGADESGCRVPAVALCSVSLCPHD